MTDWNTWKRHALYHEANKVTHIFLEPQLRAFLPVLEAANYDYGLFGLNLFRSWVSQGYLNLGMDEQGGKIQLMGEAVPPRLMPHPVKLLINGNMVADYAYGLASPLDATLDPTQQRRFGFSGVIEHTHRTLKEPLHLHAVIEPTNLPMPPLQDYWLLPCDAPLPDDDNMKRVTGGDASAIRFIMYGASFYQKLRQVVELYSTRPYEAFRDVLDWGCGCGRMLRYFSNEPEKNVVGVDIDPVNISWCKANLPQFAFATIDAHQPLPFSDGSFDLIYGNSVFTHLRPTDQDFWLGEINRVLKADGIALVTVHAQHNWVRSGWCEMAQLLQLVKDGIRVAEGHNPDIEDVIGGYYVDAAHDQAYITDHWRQFVDVLDIIESYSGTLAAVVLRKKS